MEQAGFLLLLLLLLVKVEYFLLDTFSFSPRPPLLLETGIYKGVSNVL